MIISWSSTKVGKMIPKARRPLFKNEKEKNNISSSLLLDEISTFLQVLDFMFFLVTLPFSSCMKTGILRVTWLSQLQAGYVDPTVGFDIFDVFNNLLLCPSKDNVPDLIHYSWLIWSCFSTPLWDNNYYICLIYKRCTLTTFFYKF